MEINILEFVKEYKENPVGALEKLEVENYVPFYLVIFLKWGKSSVVLASIL